MWGALTLYIIFGEPSGFEWEIPESWFTKKKDTFQRESLSYILTCGVRSLGMAVALHVRWMAVASRELTENIRKCKPFQTRSRCVVDVRFREASCAHRPYLPLIRTTSSRNWEEKGRKHAPDWVLWDQRFSPPYFHTFFIVFEVVSPPWFHNFWVNMIRHTHGNHPPVLYTFAVFHMVKLRCSIVNFTFFFFGFC